MSTGQIFLYEMIGTCIMLFLGDGVCANVGCRKSGMSGAGSVQITIAWGLAVIIPAYIFGASTGAHFNPAVTLAMAMTGAIEASTVPAYLCGELVGAFLGAFFVWLNFRDHLNDAAEEDPVAVRGMFCTAPSIPHKSQNLLSEILGTFVLIFAILGMAQVPAAATSGADKFLLWGIITSIGMSLGGLTGYAINPARDLGPRIAYAILPFSKKTDAGWDYGWIPVVGPLLGSMLAVFLYQGIF